eukprot:GHVH01004431.1.p1 GENE.GHVH01004431.1~~GHVH01004431.1.p1  ORF type:complete len:243 (+),score=19.82 GHVH01004431.1:537-1265(+)
MHGISYDKSQSRYRTSYKKNGKLFQKVFSIRAHGEAGALQMALEQRSQWIKEGKVMPKGNELLHLSSKTIDVVARNHRASHRRGNYTNSSLNMSAETPPFESSRALPDAMNGKYTTRSFADRQTEDTTQQSAERGRDDPFEQRPLIASTINTFEAGDELKYDNESSYDAMDFSQIQALTPTPINVRIECTTPQHSADGFHETEPKSNPDELSTDNVFPFPFLNDYPLTDNGSTPTEDIQRYS